MYRPRRPFPWRQPLVLLACGFAGVLALFVLSKILFVLFYLTGGLLLIAVIIWLIWRWWWWR
ncbi:hypothetical protein COLU111180_17670 [Cohnella lubricantis]|uniref:Uncharacterized protein n=1 Tax=Cohnella lubricantis TaxID=2163172 RepID=A0A841TK11_9BACL|nr:hypothetical protein [Cohnella lubricantis]MBB6679277.1 hypothetical protein [Cohnella lubricantis]MBP2119607.1 hypothetical protein [Cohnella lubricantis]